MLLLIREFAGDVDRAFRALVAAPLLAVFSVSIALAVQAPYHLLPTLSFLVIWPTLFWIGSVGTERIWYLRTFRGEEMRWVGSGR